MFLRGCEYAFVIACERDYHFELAITPTFPALGCDPPRRAGGD